MSLVVTKKCNVCDKEFSTDVDGVSDCGEHGPPVTVGEVSAVEQPTRASEQFKSRLSPGGEIASPMTPEDIIAYANAAKKNRWLAIFIQLSRCERFLKFVEANYVIQDKIDEETKSIETAVYENPRAVGPPLSRAQVGKMLAILKMYNCRKSDEALKRILATLGQEEDAPKIITSASTKDVKEAAAQTVLKDKLD